MPEPTEATLTRLEAFLSDCAWADAPGETLRSLVAMAKRTAAAEAALKASQDAHKETTKAMSYYARMEAKRCACEFDEDGMTTGECAGHEYERKRFGTLEAEAQALRATVAAQASVLYRAREKLKTVLDGSEIFDELEEILAEEVPGEENALRIIRSILSTYRADLMWIPADGGVLKTRERLIEEAERLFGRTSG